MSTRIAQTGYREGRTVARSKVLPIYLPSDVYANLERRARAEEREPVQQARWLLKQALEGPKTEAGSPASAAGR